MVHKIVQLYQDEGLRNRIVQNARETVKQFTWARAADKLERLLISIYQDTIRLRKVEMVCDEGTQSGR